MADVCLVLTPSQTAFLGGPFTQTVPLSLALGVLQGHLRALGHEVIVADLNESMPEPLRRRGAAVWLPVYDKDAVLANLRSGAPTGLEDVLDELLTSAGALEAPLLGVSSGGLMSVFEIHLSLLLAAHARREHGRRVLVGGSNLDHLWQFREVFGELWKALPDAVDALVLGPGERALAEALRALRRGAPDAAPPGALPGAVTWDHGVPVAGAPAEPVFPRPDFGGFDLRRHTICCPGMPGADEALAQLYMLPTQSGAVASAVNRQRLPLWDCHEALVLPYLSSLGCRHRCAFCVQSGDARARPVSKPPAAVVADPEALSDTYRTPYFFFLDTAFECAPATLDPFCTAVEERDLSIYWSDCARFEPVTEDVVDQLYRAGCRKLVFGLDSASPRILRLIGKRLDLDHARDVLRWCRERGLWADLEVIVGMPHEGEDEFRETYDFVAEAIADDLIVGFHANRFFVIPESLFGSRPERYGIALHVAEDAYERMLSQGRHNLAVLGGLAEGRGGSLASEFRILTHSEDGGRGSRAVQDAADERFVRLQTLLAQTRSARELRAVGQRRRRGDVATARAQ